MKLVLTVTEGKPLGQKIPVKGPLLSIGRDPKCNIRPNSDLISKVHCQIAIGEDAITVIDPGSTNGTFVNSVRITANKPVELKDGDRLTVGPLAFSVEITGVPVKSAPAKPKENEEDAMSWLMADAEGTVAEPGIDSTVMELPAGVKEQLKQDIAAGPPADVGGGGGLPEPDAGAVAAAMQKTSESKRDTREAATDILAKYLDRRRVVK